MSDKRDTPSFMSRIFPDITPLQQNKQENSVADKRKPRLKTHPIVDNFEPPPLQIVGNSTLTANDELSYQGNGVQNRIMKELKRGKISVERRLDLHGQTVEQAHQSCMRFIHHCQQAQQYCLLIIHGQGYRSTGGIPVLKQHIDCWLRQHDAVLAYCSALPRDGGKGAVYVLLRKNG
ncbi:MAG: DNA mismatch repair protein MutS [Gammaproteobacteria bacterium]|nr:DNA mismatch repair protein MutS [Gammaproteobacteria bacterium]